ncbi:TraM recognition domain-containing protein [Virgibacillus salexigens]|uniref:TraM recognition domain-containing protein n=1 Tax=Virgibacillus massiliensis TaxID=1462526 RepID=UPI00136AD6A8|nr:TraM recognition domain-containing protein [Virgibacillus massiliensis]MYL43902.1 TraM recognition domain-containing protein [Virgibacillus massiliensis]
MPKNEKKVSDDVAKEFGIVGGLLLGILVALPLFVFAIPFFVIARVVKKPKIHLWLALGSLLIFILTLTYKPIAYFGLYDVLPFNLSFLEQIVGGSFEFTAVSWVIYLSGGVSASYILNKITDYIRSKKVVSIEEEQDKFKASDEYKKIYNKRFDINDKIQRKWRKDIEANKTDKLLLGVNQRGKPYYMDFKEVNHHMFVPATTGGGKTVILLNYIEYALMMNYPIIFIDGKGSQESIDDVKALCQKYGKNLKVFSDTESLTYNPIKHGNATVIADKLQQLIETESQYYVKVNEVLVQTIIQLIDEYDFTRDLWTFKKYLDPSEIKKLLNSDTVEIEVDEEDQEESEYNSFLDEDSYTETTATKTKKKTIKKVRSERATRFTKRFFTDWESTEEGENYLFENAAVVRLAITSLLEKELGHLFVDKEDGLDLVQVSNNKEALFISFDGLIYDKYIKHIARFLILDLNFLVSYRNRNKMKDQPILAVYDEFSVYANDKIADTVNKSRSGGFHCLIATQTLADLEKVSPQLAKQVIGNTNTYAIGQTNNSEEVELWANTIGNDKDVDLTTVTEGKSSPYGRIERKADQGTVRRVQKYKIAPDDIRALRTGQFVIYRKASGDIVEPEVVYVRHPLKD